MEEIIVRELQKTDMAAITAIQKQAVLEGRGSFSLVPMDEAEMAGKFSALQTGGYPCFVAQIGSEIAGYANAAPYRSRPGYRWSIENSVYVSPGYHTRGIGTLLLQKLVEATTGSGFRQMIAVIGDSNNLGSISLHRKCGFRHTGTLKNVGFKHGKWLDVVIMQLELGDGSNTIPSMTDYPGNLFSGEN